MVSCWCSVADRLCLLAPTELSLTLYRALSLAVGPCRCHFKSKYISRCRTASRWQVKICCDFHKTVSMWKSVLKSCSVCPCKCVGAGWSYNLQDSGAEAGLDTPIWIKYWEAWFVTPQKTFPLLQSPVVAALHHSIWRLALYLMMWGLHTAAQPLKLIPWSSRYTFFVWILMAGDVWKSSATVWNQQTLCGFVLLLSQTFSLTNSTTYSWPWNI